MDPSLELQQLASQALQYSQIAQQQLQQHASSEQLDGLPTDVSTLQFTETSLMKSQSPDPEAKFLCPFPTCNRHYKRKDLLKRHLTTLLASPDEHHQDQAVWDYIRETGVMTIYTRPRNLTEEQKKQRRKESNLRHRVKYASELKEKRNRKRRVEKLLEGRQVGVQTPDWEEEARVNAGLSGAVGVGTVEPVPVVSSVVETVVVTNNAPAKPGRRSGRKQWGTCINIGVLRFMEVHIIHIELLNFIIWIISIAGSTHGIHRWTAYILPLCLRRFWYRESI